MKKWMMSVTTLALLVVISLPVTSPVAAADPGGVGRAGAPGAVGGPGGPGGAGGPRGGPRDRGGPELRLAAEFLALTPRELLDALREGQTIAQIAADQGHTLEEVVAAVTAPVAERLASLVAEGTLTQPQADFRLNEVTTHATYVVTLPLRHGKAGAELDVAAQAMGITLEALIAALDGGQTVAEVAQANGSSAEAVVDALITARQETLDEAVQLDLLTETQAGLELNRYSNRAAHFVDNYPGEQGEGPRGPRPGAPSDAIAPEGISF